MGFLVGFLYRQWLITECEPQGRQGFFLPLFSFAVLITAFRRKYSSNSIPVHHFFFFIFSPETFYWHNLGHLDSFVFSWLPFLLSGANGSCAPAYWILSKTRTWKQYCQLLYCRWIVIFSKVMAFHCCSTCLARHYAVNMWALRWSLCVFRKTTCHCLNLHMGNLCKL